MELVQTWFLLCRRAPLAVSPPLCPPGPSAEAPSDQPNFCLLHYLLFILTKVIVMHLQSEWICSGKKILILASRI